MDTAEWVREYLDYNPETGDFIWKKRPSIRVVIGAKAGCAVYANGYRGIGIKGRIYHASRLAVLWMTGEWPPEQVDHINGDRADDRWCNLRLASHQQNQASRGRQINNKSGFKGVSWDKQKQKWRGRIKHKGKLICLGFYATPEEAHEAYRVVNLNLNGEYACN